MGHVEKLKLRFLHNKKIKLSGSVTHLILETAILYKISVEFKQKSINTKELFSQNLEVSLHFWRIWPTVWHPLCGPFLNAEEVMTLSGHLSNINEISMYAHRYVV